MNLASELEVPEDLTSPEDFPETFPFLVDVDRELRCPICAEFFVGAVALPCCGVAFCSLCLRSAMAAGDTQCPNPVCRKTASEASIRSVATLNKVVEAWVTGRSLLLRFVLENQASTKSGACDRSPPTRREKALSKTSSRSRKGISKSPTLSQVARNKTPSRTDCMATTSSTQLQQAPSPSQRRKAPSPSQLKKAPSKTKLDSRDENGNSSSNILDAVVVPSQFGEVDDDLDRCFVCSAKVSQSKMARHVDQHFAAEDRVTRSKGGGGGCVLTGGGGESIRSGFGGDAGRRNSSLPLVPTQESRAERRPLPKLNYHIMQIKELKSRCESLKLSTAGKKEKLIQRHRIYTLLHNSNLDAVRPKSDAELRRETTRREAAGDGAVESGVGASQASIFSSPKGTKKGAAHVATDAGTSSGVVAVVGKSINKTSKPEAIERVLKEYERTHRDQFAELIAKARGAGSKKSKLPQGSSVEFSEEGNSEKENKEDQRQGNDKSNEVVSSQLSQSRGREYHKRLDFVLDENFCSSNVSTAGSSSTSTRPNRTTPRPEPAPSEGGRTETPLSSLPAEQSTFGVVRDDEDDDSDDDDFLLLTQRNPPTPTEIEIGDDSDDLFEEPPTRTKRSLSPLRHEERFAESPSKKMKTTRRSSPDIDSQLGYSQAESVFGAGSGAR